MNRLLLLLALVLFGTGSRAQMRQVFLDTAASNDIVKLSFYSDQEGYIASKKWIGYTNDSGHTVERKFITNGNVNYNGFSVNLTFGFTISGVHAFGKDTLLVYGDYGLVPAILYSTDAAASYKLIFHNRINFTTIEDMFFAPGSSTGYAVDNDRILKSTDRGLTWVPSFSYSDRGFKRVLGFDENNVVALGPGVTATILLKTSNGGSTWTAVTAPAQQRYRYVQFRNATNLFVSTTDVNTTEVNYYHSANGGASWRKMNDPAIAPVYSLGIYFINDSTGFSINEQYQLYKTSDTGRTWEPLRREPPYTYLLFTHKTITGRGASLLWAGGGHGLLEISSNMGGVPVPKAFFKADTTGESAGASVRLLSYSKQQYQHRWYLNGTLLASTYTAAYTHDPDRQRDTVMLIVSSGSENDTAIKYLLYPLRIKVSSFSPQAGATGSMITIKGRNFWQGVNAVKFGGTPASQYVIDSDTTIRAYVAGGSSGAVGVYSASNGAGLKDGFTYVPPPTLTLPVSLSTQLLCKSGSVVINITNAENDVRYDFVDSLDQSFGGAVGSGSGFSFAATGITRTGTYRLKARRLLAGGPYYFPTSYFINVEKPQSSFLASRCNALLGEGVGFYQASANAVSYSWTFPGDASSLNGSAPAMRDIHFNSPGLKSIRLVSSTANGCRDTVQKALYVYTKPQPDNNCFLYQLDSLRQAPHTVQMILPAGDNGYLLAGSGNGQTIFSRIGLSGHLAPGGGGYLARYSTDGALRWFITSEPGLSFSRPVVDAQGNIYLIGNALANVVLRLPENDSVRFVTSPLDTTASGAKRNGFVIKTDSSGRYLWHTLFTSTVPVDFNNLNPVAGFPAQIAVSGNHVLLFGALPASTNYIRNGAVTPLPDPITGNSNNFVLKLDPTGAPQWKALVSHTTNGFSGATNISVDAQGSVYLLGTYDRGARFFDAGGNLHAALYTRPAYNRSYLVKYNSAGTIEWHNELYSGSIYGHVSLSGLATDAAGNSYVTGSCENWGSAERIVAAHSNGTVYYDSTSSFTLFKFDKSGKVVWSTGARYPRGGRGIKPVLRGSDLFVAGQLWDDDVYPYCLLTSTDGNQQQVRISETDFFVARYDTSGRLKRFARSGASAGGQLRPADMMIDGNANLLLAVNGDTYNGGAGSVSSFGMPLTYAGSTGDGFVQKLNPDLCVPSAPPAANAGADRTICAGDSTVLGTALAGGLRAYWRTALPGYFSMEATPKVAPSATTVYILAVSDAWGLTTQDTVTITVLPSPLAHAGPAVSLCAGASVLIGAAPTGGNTYAWSSRPAGFSSASANPSVTPASTTTYFVSVAAANGCHSTDSTVVTVAGTYTPQVSISASSAMPICGSTQLTFRATATHPGSAPVYEWTVNGSPVGTNNTVFTPATPVPQNGQVRVRLTSSVSCAAPAQVSSNTIAVTYRASTVPEVTLYVSGPATVPIGSRVDLYAFSNNLVPNFEWEDSSSLHNWRHLTYSNVSYLPYYPLAAGTKLRCCIRSDRECPTSPVTCSSPVLVNASVATAVAHVDARQYDIRLFPNPSQRQITISGLRISDRWQTLRIISSNGAVVRTMPNLAGRSTVVCDIAELTSGYYLVELFSPARRTVLTFIKQ